MCVAFPSVAATIEAAFNSVNIMVNGARQADIGESLRLADGREVPYSINYNGTVYLPLRKLAELIGMEVAWDAGTSTAALYDGRSGRCSIYPPMTAIRARDIRPSYMYPRRVERL